MAMKKRTGPGNIKPDHQFNPFRREGLTNDFEPFIRKEVDRYCKSYPHVPRGDMLGEAVRLSLLAEARFQPALGHSFATFVAPRLRELHRFARAYDGHQQVKIYEAPEAKAKRLAEERGEDPRPIAFKGGNGARLTLDWQSIRRCRVVFGLQIRTAMDAIGLADRLQELRRLIPGRTDGIGAAYFRAVADHLFRRQQEADDEAAKRVVGDHSPTFLEAEPVTNVQPVGAKKPPKFLPEYLPVISLDDTVGFDEDGHRLTLHDVIAAPERTRVPEAEAIEAINQRRQFMSRTEDIAADTAIETIRGKPYSLSDLANRLGMTKGGASKVWHRMLSKACEK
jgi:hypothetical protein